MQTLQEPNSQRLLQEPNGSHSQRLLQESNQRLLQNLSNVNGNATSMISLIVPGNTNL